MFDTEKFIAEVHSRECIWNANSEEYSDRNLRRCAWEDIASVMYEDWGVYGTKKRNETIQELQKKWKHLRDYFVREKNKEQNIKSGSGAPKKRKTPYLDMLQFLTISRASSPASVTNIQLPSARTPVSHSSGNNTINYNEDSCDNTIMNNSSQQSKSKGLTVFQQCLLNSMNRQEQNNMNPHMNFLMSLVPEMNTMSERQLFEFKFEIMKIIHKIKYNNDYIYGSGPSTSTSYQHEHYYDYDRASYGYMSSPQNRSQCTPPPQPYQVTSSPTSMQRDAANAQIDTSENNTESPDNVSEPASIEDIERILQGD